MKKFADLAELLRDYRMHKELTQMDLAALLDVDKRSVIRWENGDTQLTRDKEADFAEALAIPFQVIHNLNSDPPIAIYYDIARRSYSHSAFASVIQDAHFFTSQYPIEEDSMRPLSEKHDFEHILKHKQWFARSLPKNTLEILMLCAQILPELNIVSLAQSMTFNGHLAVIPLSAKHYRAIIEQESNELPPDEIDRSGHPIHFFVFSAYADSLPPAYYIMNRFFTYFKDKNDYQVAAVAETENARKLWAQAGLTQGQELNDGSGRCFMYGEFREFLKE